MSEVLNIDGKLVSDEGEDVLIVASFDTIYSNCSIHTDVVKYKTFSNPIRPSGDFIIEKINTIIPK